MKINNLNIGEFTLNKEVRIIMSYERESVMNGKISGLYMDCDKNIISLEITIGNKS